MSKLLSFCLVILTLFTLTLNSAEAARFGGGRSFGAQRSISSFSRMQQPLRPAATAQRAGANRWAAPLAGLAIGSLLGYLMMGHGFSSGILTWIAIFGIGTLIFSFLRRKTQLMSNNSNYQQVNENNNVYDARSRFAYQNGNGAMPAGFDETAFLRDAKVQFIRLQASYDAKNLSDIREFTTSEVFAEIQLQFQERGDKPNQTEVVSVDAELLDASEDHPSTLATVKFTGMIREEAGQPANAFSEIWHFKKDLLSQHWLVAGLQQA